MSICFASPCGGRLDIDHVEIEHTETEPPDLERIKRALSNDGGISHVAMVHCETTTGMLNPAVATVQLQRQHTRPCLAV